MTVSEVLNQVELAQGTNAKISILRQNKDLPHLKKALEYGLDSFKKFGVIKIPEVTDRSSNPGSEEVWSDFFQVLDLCASRDLTGNAAISSVHNVLKKADVETEKWMRKILLKHFNVGASRKSVEKVYGEIVKTFEVQLAAKWHDRTLEDLPAKVRVEPKLDGIRMISVVKGGQVEMFSRAGKVITNFQDTVGKEVSSLPDGVYDGEVMDEDFTALMRQVHRKFGTNVSKSYYMVFDVLTLEEWENRSGLLSLEDRRKNLESVFKGKKFDYLRIIDHKEVDADVNSIMSYHKECVDRGFEGAMLKNPGMVYNFGRSDAVVKVKAFNDVDLKVAGFLEGRGRHEGTLGAILVDFNGVQVRVGSGFSDDQRSEVWSSKERFLGMTAEVRYQEITPDGSLRFPTFVCWRLDK